MQTLPNEIVLRPRFQRNVSRMKEKLLEDFEVSEKAPFLVKRLNEHVFIKFDKTNNYFWSRLHLEINTLDTNRSRVYGVFGPNPTFRTFFVFFHFGIALLLAILGIWAYSKPTLKKPMLFKSPQRSLWLFCGFCFIFLGGRKTQREASDDGTLPVYDANVKQVSLYR